MRWNGGRSPRCSVFSGGWQLEATQALVAAIGDGRSVAAVLRALVDKSLVESIDDGKGSIRYDMLETIRAYAAGRLSQTTDTKQAGALAAGITPRSPKPPRRTSPAGARALGSTDWTRMPQTCVWR